MTDTTPAERLSAFQAGHTYTRTVSNGATEEFRVEYITHRPDSTAAYAFGWKGGLGAWYGRLVPVVDCLGWIDATPVGGQP